MSDVKRYLMQKTPIGTMMKPNSEGNWISSDDFDRVTAERDTALAELKTQKLRADAAVGDANEAEQRLTAADERADAAIAFVTRLIECAGDQPSIATGYLSDILAALKPAEDGGDDR